MILYENKRVTSLTKTSLRTLDSSAGVNLIVNRRQGSIQENGTNEANKYKQKYCIAYPPFSVFC